MTTRGLTIKIGILALMILPLSAALGSYFLPINLGAITLYGYRIFVLIFLLLIFTLKLKIKNSLLFQWVVLLFSTWLIWANLSIFWTPDIVSGMKSLFALIIGIACTIIIIAFTNRPNRIQYLRYGWIIAFIVTGCFAIWEITTGNHLPSNYQSTQPDYILKRLYVASTFGNPNNYAAFLILCFPFLVWSVIATTNKSLKLFYYILLVFFPIFLLLTASRICLLGWIVELLLIVILLMKRMNKVYFLSLSLIATFYILGSGLIDDITIITKVANTTDKKGSLLVRENLLLNGLWLVKETNGVGVGIGGFEYVIRKGYIPYPTYGISNPHNFSIEILAEFGIIIFFFYIFMMMLIVYKSILKIHSKTKAESQLGIIIFIAICGYVFASVASSSYMETPINWVFIGSIIATLLAPTYFKEA